MKQLGLKQEHEEKKAQEVLKKAYGIKKDVLVVERRSRIVMLAKALLNFSLSLLRVLGMVALCFLATIGLMALIYPSIRTVLNTELQEIIRTLKDFLSF